MCRGFGRKLPNKRVEVGWDKDTQQWVVKLRNMVSRKDRKINEATLILTDDVMRSVVGLSLQVFNDRDIYTQ